jgi:hypothetical protein
MLAKTFRERDHPASAATLRGPVPAPVPSLFAVPVRRALRRPLEVSADPVRRGRGSTVKRHRLALLTVAVTIAATTLADGSTAALLNRVSNAATNNSR